MRVLCFFKYLGRTEGRLVERHDSVMVVVASLADVQIAFDRKIAMNRKHGTWIGPKPLRWQLTGYFA